MKELQTFRAAYRDHQKICARNSLPNQDVDLSKIDDYKRLFMNVARKVCPLFVVREEYKPIYNDIVLYCLMADGNLNPRKGLWLWGDIGTGKTTLLNIVREFCSVVRPADSDGQRYSFRITNAIDVCAQFADKGYGGIETYIGSAPEKYIGMYNINLSISRQAFDEIGSEARITQHYGCAENVFQYILQRRYERHDGVDNITHATTNLELGQIKDEYGARIHDRCKEMFNFVALRGKTFRV